MDTLEHGPGAGTDTLTQPGPELVGATPLDRPAGQETQVLDPAEALARVEAAAATTVPDVVAAPAAPEQVATQAMPAVAPEAPAVPVDAGFELDDKKQDTKLAAQDARYKGLRGFGNRIIDRVKKIL